MVLKRADNFSNFQNSASRLLNKLWMIRIKATMTVRFCPVGLLKPFQLLAKTAAVEYYPTCQEGNCYR